MSVTYRPIGTVLPTASALGWGLPLSARDVAITGGFWADRLQINRERTFPHGFAQLERSGNLQNLRLAAGAEGRYQALGTMFDTPFPFLDSDVYKWLEGVAWELGREAQPDLERAANVAIDLVARAQEPDGYINSYVQVLAPGHQYRDLHWGHELYCIGHLIQAAVAWHRALADDRLLEIATRAADSVDRTLGPAGRSGIDGHPGIEMALVELFRVTGERRYLELAARFVDLRGHGLLGSGRFGAAYWQDHAAVREAPTVAGHAVRQLYLDCGAVDVATELRDTGLLAAVHHRWREMIATRTYLTGGLGSHHRDEAFGDPFELPPDRAYAESCAAIASVMLAWRLLLATGDPDCADVIERTMYNGVLPGIGLDGTSFFYVNALQRRTDRASAEPDRGERAPWYPCACCPPNLMRILSSWPQYLATGDESGLQVHQYASGILSSEVDGGRISLSIETDYPWSGRVTLKVLQAPGRPWTLSLRVPAWTPSATITWANDAAEGATSVAAPATYGARPPAAPGRSVARTQLWKPGDSVVLEMEMSARFVEPNDRIDAVRNCVAIERGPLVYCVETADLPPGIALEEVAVDVTAVPVAIPRDDIARSLIGLRIPAVRRPHSPSSWPYRPAGGRGSTSPTGPPIMIGAVPYFAWANRSVEAMRVWVPRAERPIERS